MPSSRRALRLTEVARDLGLHEATHDRLMDAYWDEGLDIGQPEVLRRLAAEIGLPDDEVGNVLDGEKHLDRLAASTRQAASIGVTGVPAFLLDGRLLVLGAQPREVFERALERLD